MYFSRWQSLFNCTRCIETLAKLNAGTMEAQLLMKERILVNNVMDHDVAKWHLRHSAAKNSKRNSGASFTSADVRWVNFSTAFTFLSLTNRPYLFVALVNARRTASGSVLGAVVPRPVQPYSTSTTSGFSARVSTHGMWWLILLSPSFLPFLLARTRNYSTLSYFLSSFRTTFRLRSSSCSPRLLRRATLRSILA